MNVYLDIDGVLLANDKFATVGADEFVQYVLQHYPDSTHWLTTHCRGGENRAVELLADFLQPQTVQLLGKIKMTDWGMAKTDAIDFNEPFLWFDDDLYSEERRVLESHGCMANWVEVDLRKDPNMLQKLVQDFPTPVQPKSAISDKIEQ